MQIRAGIRRDAVITALALTACSLVLVFKLLVTTRLNVGWDEFWLLHLVHSSARGEFGFAFETVHVWLFEWLPATALAETGQVVAARVVMVILLAVTTLLLWLTGKRWLDGFAAAVPPLLYLTLVPVLAHGGAFRAGSMLAPLLMGAMLSLTRGPDDRRHLCLAGALLGMAAAISAEVLLFVPLVAAVAATLPANGAGAAVRTGRKVASRLALVTLSGVAAWTLVTAIQWLRYPSMPVAESLGNLPSLHRLAPALLPRTGLVTFFASWQPLPWILIVSGTAAAIARRRYFVAAVALALLPAFVYSGAYSSFFVVMMAPACLLAGYSVQWLLGLASTPELRHWRSAVAWALLLALLYPFLDYSRRLWLDEQSVQRGIVAAVHEIFPEPVGYLDRCGMIASFPKVNGLVTNSSLAAYRAGRKPFMPAMLRDNPPAFVLMNTPAFSPGRARSNGLLEADRELLARFYPRYWGPIRVAGAEARLQPGRAQRIELPFPAEYRVESDVSILVNGTPRAPGDIVDVTRYVTIEVPAADPTKLTTVPVKLFLASAAGRPATQLDPQPIFTGY